MHLLVIFHMHSDHYGNAIDIINDDNFKINSLIIKGEKYSNIDEKIKNAAKNKNINIIETKLLKDVFYYQLSDNIRMYLFNVKDVFENENCNSKGYVLNLTSNINVSKFNYAKSTDEKYIYINGNEYLKNGYNVIIHQSDNLENVVDANDRINSRFYFYITDKERNNCSSNANTIAIFFSN